MNRLLPFLLALLVADLAVAEGTNGQQVLPQTPVFDTNCISRLTNGMTLAEFQEVVGIPGEVRPNSSFVEAIYDFDFSEVGIMATVQTRPAPPKIKSYKLTNYGVSIQQRKDARSKAWGEWVDAHRQTRVTSLTNAVEQIVRAVHRDVVVGEKPSDRILSILQGKFLSCPVTDAKETNLLINVNCGDPIYHIDVAIGSGRVTKITVGLTPIDIFPP